MLTHNVNTCDSLTNGSFGEVIGIELDNNRSVSKIIVNFFDEKSGHEKRKNHVQLQEKYPGKKATPIERIECQYSLSKKSSVGVNNAVAIQFPLRLAFAATSHKVQGQTVKNQTVLFLILEL